MLYTGSQLSNGNWFDSKHSKPVIMLHIIFLMSTINQKGQTALYEKEMGGKGCIIFRLIGPLHYRGRISNSFI
jgi:hypothetical protein